MVNCDLSNVEDTLYIKVYCKLDSITSPVLKQEIDQYINNVKEVVFDLEDMPYLTSVGIRLLVSVTKSHSNVRIINVSKIVMDIIELTGMDEVLNVENNSKKRIR